jgi:hypothetical protein
MIGDEVSDADRRRGVVTHLVSTEAEDVEMVIEWEDGTTGIRHFPA